MVDHPNIKTTTSLVDFVFRALAYEYLRRTDLVHVLDKEEVVNFIEEESKEKPALSSVRITSALASNLPVVPQQKLQKTVSVKNESSLDAVNAAAKSMQSDAPSCNTCGHITVRSGTCYKCLNCGNSMGCS